MREAIRNVLGRGPYDWLRRALLPVYDPYRKISYSQDAEDLILDGLLFRQQRGAYIDVGAFDPISISNTYLFYRRGWSGLNIDATPGSMERFQRFRPRDTNIEALVGDSADPMTFHIFNHPVLNTFDGSLAEKQNGTPSSAGGTIEIVSTMEIYPKPLAAILREHWPAGQPVDFMSIDVEGAELSVLRSNDWGKYRPRVIVIEALDANVAALSDLPAHQLLSSIGYRCVAKSVSSLFYKDHCRP